MSNPLRRAYRDAWHVRDETGDDSPALLLEQLRANDADPVWFEPDGGAHKWLLGCWARGVKPHGLAVESAREIGALVPRVVKPIRDALKTLR